MLAWGQELWLAVMTPTCVLRHSSFFFRPSPAATASGTQGGVSWAPGPDAETPDYMRCKDLKDVPSMRLKWELQRGTNNGLVDFVIFLLHIK